VQQDCNDHPTGISVSEQLGDMAVMTFSVHIRAAKFWVGTVSLQNKLVTTKKSKIK